ncbi:MAG TPA: IS66 family transposase [Acidimicrobiales bacterium]|jgi:transposase|nr:IS66 family transposase [Acidimicrobiales bacterium]
MASGVERSDAEVVIENDRLRGEVERLTSEVDRLAGENVGLRSEIDSFARKIASLEKRIGKNSVNSSLPPSSDLFGRSKDRPENANRAQRRALGRKPGKQTGTDGKHLAHVDDPDEVHLHTPSACDGCGADLADVPVERTEIRQVTDIPTSVPTTTEHRAESKRCGCGTVTKAAFPKEARGHASYGPRIRATALYLLSRQHLPFERTKEAMADLLGVTVSTGFLDSVYSEGADGLAGFLTAVLAQLRDTDVVYMDETSDRLGKGSVWFHVACTELLTLLHADITRGPDGIEATGLLPDFDGVAVHDRLGWYFDYDQPTHAACGAHLLRNLASVGVSFDQTEWTSSMAALLLEMKAEAATVRGSDKKKISKKILAGYLARYDAIVGEALAANPAPIGRRRDSIEAEGYNLALAFRTRKDAICRFATDLRVDFTNNLAERDLRMVKIHKKVSTSFRAMEGAERLATVRSYVGTAIKHGLDPLDVLVRLFHRDPWIPQRT